ncbi:hypothetical protein FBEOM_10083 [Fusarium beomiforme]|uniref:C2H2-type domain-containing protein n=1 Tax=Fusarium beomiforme TaxID=44412 RepID=A0A9P5DVP3_9HYPO|nr:hypothetical protein FBEOM_10083 [Fusarium beomiforme]
MNPAAPRNSPWPISPTDGFDISGAGKRTTRSKNMSFNAPRGGFLPDKSYSDQSCSVELIPQPDTKPISHDQLVAEVKSIYAGLVMIESKCIEVDNAQSLNTDADLKLINEQWQALIAFHRQLLHEHDDAYNISLVPKQQSYDLRTLLSEYYVHSKSSRVLNSRLLPLLRREKDTPSCRQLIEYSRLVSYLFDILHTNSSLLDYTDILLMGLLDSIAAIIERLNLRFRRKYEDLKHKNACSQIIFEFPNNMRHVCTTMPWTILPALLVLWGVCWMFIIGPGEVELEKPNTPFPTFSPVPAGYDFYKSSLANHEDEFHAGFVSDFSTAPYGDQLTLGFFYGGIGATNDQLDPINFVQAAPQDPDFLALDTLSRVSTGDTGRPGKKSYDPTETPPATVTLNPVLQSYDDANYQGRFDPTVNVALVGDENQDTSSDQNAKSRFTCPVCQQTFATSFTLGRHQTEAHRARSSIREELFPCPNPGCKRSKGGSPFKRPYNLKRHVEVCKHGRNSLALLEESTEPDGHPPSQSTSVPVVSHELQPSETESEQATPASSIKKRSRSESDEELSDEILLREMMKKYKRMAQDVKEKEDAYLQALEGLKSFEKTIHVLKDSQKNIVGDLFVTPRSDLEK